MFEVSTTSFHTNVDERRLVAERAKFAMYVMVSAAVCFGGKGRLHFIPDTVRVNAKLYVETLLTELVQECRSILPSGFIFCWLKTGLLPTAVNSLVKMNGLRTHLTSTLWSIMSGELCLNATSHFNPSRRWAQESSAVHMGPAATGRDQQSHIELPEKTPGLCESWWWTLRTYAKMNYLSDFGICVNSQCFMTMEITSCCWLFRAIIENMA